MENIALSSGIGSAVEKLTRELMTLQEQLRRREASIGKGHDLQKIKRLREQIEKVEARLCRAERLQEKFHGST